MAKQYRLTLGEQADLTLNRLATENGQSVSEIMRNAINTYATLKRRSEDGYVFVRRHGADGQIAVTKIALP